MRLSKALGLLWLAVVPGACATSGQLHDIRLFQQRPAKPTGCPFELYEQREPAQEYEVIGTLSLTGNEWLGTSGRKQLLGDTVCQSGADAVILSSPAERKVANARVREYQAQFISFSPGSSEPAALPALPDAEPGAIIAPRGMEWPEESVGESTRKWEPQKAEPPKK